MLAQFPDLVEDRYALSHGIPNCAVVQSKTLFVSPTVVIAVDIQTRSVRNIDLPAADVPAPREHLHVCPLTVATAAQHAVYLFELVWRYRRPNQIRE